MPGSRCREDQVTGRVEEQGVREAATEAADALKDLERIGRPSRLRMLQLVDAAVGGAIDVVTRAAVQISRMIHDQAAGGIGQALLRRIEAVEDILRPATLGMREFIGDAP